MPLLFPLLWMGVGALAWNSIDDAIIDQPARDPVPGTAGPGLTGIALAAGAAAAIWYLSRRG